jgi:myo-inositol-1(or 4)-monophosphatase
MKQTEIKKALDTAIRAARAAGKLMRQNLRAAKVVNEATSHDIKLELDVRCQKLIEKILRAAFPEIALLGEEGDSGNTGEEWRWVVDPIDGTVNFAYGIPHACVSIALQKRSGKNNYASILGVVFDPFQDELWTATRGGKAFLNGRPICVSARNKLADCIVSIGFAKSKSNTERGLPYFAWLVRRVRKIRMLGSAALGLTYVATGRLDAYIERGVSLWDIAAGGLIIECAGGKFWTQPIPGKEKVRMIASNGVVHRKLPNPK